MVPFSSTIHFAVDQRERLHLATKEQALRVLRH